VSIVPEGDPLPLEENHVQSIAFLSPAGNGHILIRNPRWNLEVGSLQAFLDAYCRENGEAEMDYIHGDDVLRGLSSRPSTMGFLLPVLSKHDLFKTIILEGVLPRKAFSMGHADEKRYYVECRKIVP
jgi:hypothetical protein